MLAHLWEALWPNVVAPSAWTLLGIGAHHVALRRQARRLHEETRAHVTRTAATDSGSEAK
jgi:hypothetical protein